MLFPAALVTFAITTTAMAAPQPVSPAMSLDTRQSGSRPLGWIYGYSQADCAGSYQSYEVHSLEQCYPFSQEYASIKYVRSAWKDGDPQLVGLTASDCSGVAHAKVNAVFCASGTASLNSGRFE